MNGNQTATLAFNYMIEARKAKGIADPNDMVVKTIVTTDLIDEIAWRNRISCYNVLTGFKYIAELIKEKEGRENYVIGGEESYGLMIGSQIRDKDAVSAVALLCEMAAYEKDKGRSLYDKLIDLYVQYGFYKESPHLHHKKGDERAKGDRCDDERLIATSRRRPSTGLPSLHYSTMSCGPVRTCRPVKPGPSSCPSRMYCSSSWKTVARYRPGLRERSPRSNSTSAFMGLYRPQPIMTRGMPSADGPYRRDHQRHATEVRL